MSKLFKLKEWLTIPEAAKHLSIVLAEPVTEADILRLALDGHLKLSIHFINATEIERGVVWRVRETGSQLDKVRGVFAGARQLCERAHLGDMDAQKHTPQNILFHSECMFETTGKKISAKGIFDLTMLGDDSTSLESKFQCMTGGPDVDKGKVYQAIISDESGATYCINVPLDANDPLPDDARIIVRTSALREFEQLVAGKSEGIEEHFPTTERNALLKQIGVLSLALAEQSKKYKRGEKPNGLQIATVAGEIVDALPGGNIRGVGPSSIRESIRQGIELLIAIQQ